jgi:hypothetical protein
MKIRRIAIALLQLSSVFYLTNCMGHSSSASNGNDPALPATITISPQPVSIAAGATVTFTAYTTNASGYTPIWALNVEDGSAGTLSTVGGTTVTYTAPPTPPIYTSSFTPQGTVTLTVSVENVEGCDDAEAHASFVITSPTITVGVSPLTASVAVGQTPDAMQLFTGYAVGNVNGALTWQVNGVTGGSTAYGTITATGSNPVYTPPMALPMTGNTVTITAISQADPSKTASATVTLH